MDRQEQQRWQHSRVDPVTIKLEQVFISCADEVFLPQDGRAICYGPPNNRHSPWRAKNSHGRTDGLWLGGDRGGHTREQRTG